MSAIELSSFITTLRDYRRRAVNELRVLITTMIPEDLPALYERGGGLTWIQDFHILYAYHNKYTRSTHKREREAYE